MQLLAETNICLEKNQSHAQRVPSRSPSAAQDECHVAAHPVTTPSCMHRLVRTGTPCQMAPLLGRLQSMNAFSTAARLRDWRRALSEMTSADRGLVRPLARLGTAAAWRDPRIASENKNLLYGTSPSRLGLSPPVCGKTPWKFHTVRFLHNLSGIRLSSDVLQTCVGC
jgi:hypothetical protein